MVVGPSLDKAMVNFPSEEIAIRALSFTLSDFIKSENHALSTSEGAFLNEGSPSNDPNPKSQFTTLDFGHRTSDFFYHNTDSELSTRYSELKT